MDLETNLSHVFKKKIQPLHNGHDLGFFAPFSHPLSHGGLSSSCSLKKNMNWVYPPISPIEISIYRKKCSLIFHRFPSRCGEREEESGDNKWRDVESKPLIWRCPIHDNTLKSSKSQDQTISIHILIMKNYENLWLGDPPLKKPPMSQGIFHQGTLRHR